MLRIWDFPEGGIGISPPEARLGVLMLTIIIMLIITGVILGLVLLNVLLLTYMERKVVADMQVRYGPMRVGWHGILQPIADALKLLIKEDIVPTLADKWLFLIAPIMVFVPAFLMYVTLPLTKNLVVSNLDIGIFFIFAIVTIMPIGILIAGWGSFNKYTLLGGFRGAAQQISYEVPMLLSILGIVMLSESYSLTDIVEAQKPLWFIFFQPFGFLFFLIATIAKLNRVPFDIPEAESELVQGYMVEYSGMRFAFFFLAEYSNLFVVSALATILFFGGWQGPLLPPLIWFLIKTYIIVFVIIWIRATLPRIRVDQLMSLGWKILLPLTLLNILVTGLLMI